MHFVTVYSDYMGDVCVWGDVHFELHRLGVVHATLPIQPKKGACLCLRKNDVGNGLLSHTVTSAVPSALVGLTSGFGMGPGVPPQL